MPARDVGYHAAMRPDRNGYAVAKTNEDGGLRFHATRLATKRGAIRLAKMVSEEHFVVRSFPNGWGLVWKP